MDYPLLARMPDGTARGAGGPVAAVGAGRDHRRRSASCGPDCAAEPCTLRQMRAGTTRPRASDPRITLWAELAVLAHLTGWVMPRPSPAGRSLRGMPGRLRDCALSHAVDAAVAARGPVIDQPASFAAHVTDALRARIARQPTCPAEEPEWLGRPYRWALIHDAFKNYSRKNPGARRHPRSDSWGAIPGADVAEQWTTLQQWFLADLRDTVAVSTISWGAASPSVIEKAVGVNRTDPAWKQRLTELLEWFPRASWPHRYLTQADPQEGP